MTAEWNECVVKAREAVERALSVGDTYVDQFEKLLGLNFNARKRLNRLLYWLDIDSEVFERMSDEEQADHLHMKNEVLAIRDILRGKERADGEVGSK